MGHCAIFTHNDLDALGSALLAQVALPGADVFFCDYANLCDLLAPRVGSYDVFWFADLGLRDEALLDLLHRVDGDVYWFDHHASSLPQSWMAECVIDVSGTKCAAEVVNDYVTGLGFDIPVALQTLTEYCHDQDLWVRQIPEAQHFSDILGQMGVFDLYRLLREDLGRVYHWTDGMTAAAAATAEARAWSIKLAEDSAVVHELGGGLRLRAACCWGSTSEVGEALGDDDTLVALLDLRNLDRSVVKCSLRTRSASIPAHRVAERMGGGGHPQASGAPLDPNVLKALSEALAGEVQRAARGVLGGS